MIAEKVTGDASRPRKSYRAYFPGTRSRYFGAHLVHTVRRFVDEEERGGGQGVTRSASFVQWQRKVTRNQAGTVSKKAREEELEKERRRAGRGGSEGAVSRF